MKRHALCFLAAGATVLLGCADSSSDLAAVEQVEQAVRERAEADLTDFLVTGAVCVRAEGSDRRYECEVRAEDDTYSYSAVKGEGDRVVVESLEEPGDGAPYRLGGGYRLGP